MRIKIKEITVEGVNKGRTKYEIANVTYQQNGETKTFKVFSFKNPQVFTDLQDVSAGEEIDVTTTKGDDGYWQWTKISKGGSAQAAPAAQARGSYAENDAKRQVYIIKQSSFQRAVEAVGADKEFEEYAAFAQKVTDWVLGNDTSEVDAEG